MNATHLDLFSGIGGFALAARWAGFQTVGFCEIEPFAQRVLAKNFGAVLADSCGTGSLPSTHARIHRSEEGAGARNVEPQRCRLFSDIRTLNGRDFAGVSLITGGFPCQPFSCAGKRRGKEDDRHLWPEMLRVISEARPAWVLGENVAGIINMELDAVLSDLEAIGYACRPFVIPACGVDARHRRNRVWIVAYDEKRSRCNGGIKDEEGHWASWSGREAGTLCCDVPYPFCERRRSGNAEGQDAGDAGELPTGSRDDTGGVARWLPEPDMGRVAHGIPSRVDRLRGLGNAIVPQAAFPILKAIRELI